MQLAVRLKSAPVVGTALRLQRAYGHEKAGLLASAIAYHAFFSVFPLILVGFSVLGYLVDDPRTQRDVLERLAGTVPGIRPLLGDTLDALVRTRAATGVVGLLGFAWTGTQIVRASGAALQRVFRIDLPKDSFVKQNAWALGALATLGVLAFASLGVSFLGGLVPSLGPATSILLFATGAAVDLGMFLVAYRVLTRGRGPAFRALLPGAILATAGWTLLKVLGAWYARQTVGDAQAVYGTFAAAIGVLALLSFGARIFLYGAVFTTIVNPREPDQTQTSEVVQMDETREMDALRNGEAERTSRRTTVRLVRDIADDTATLVKKEVELARIELVDAVNARIRALAAVMGAGVLALMTLIFLGLAAEAALSQTMPEWAARLAVAAGATFLAGMAVIFAIQKMRTPSLKPEETVRTVKEDVEWAKAQLRR